MKLKQLLQYLIKLSSKNLRYLTIILNGTSVLLIIFLFMKRVEVLRKKAMKKLTFKETTENISIVKYMEPLDFIPAFFIPTYLTQAGFHEMKNIQTTFFKREYLINNEDNGLISLDWVTLR